MSLEGRQLGRYKICRLLGSGGMGEVYLAEDPQIDNRQIAIKVISAEISPYPNMQIIKDATRLFRHEAQAIASLDHPHILPLYDFGESTINGTRITYLVTPFRQEGSFANWLRRCTSPDLLPLEDVVYFISQMAEALQYVHDHHIVHRDVKPSNFLIRENKRHPLLPDLILADFGISQIMGTAASVSVRGTPNYMAPEQWEGHPVPATDQYALAAIAYELLTGQTVFQSTTQEEVMFHHLNTQPQSPNLLNHRVPPTFDAVLLRALAKRPEDRYPSVSMFANAFQNALSDDFRLAPTVLKASSERSFVLSITETEQQMGTRHSVILPEGQRVTVTVPAGVQEGQVLRPDPTLQPEKSNNLPSSTQFTVTVISHRDPAPNPTPPHIPSPTPLSINSTPNLPVERPSELGSAGTPPVQNLYYTPPRQSPIPPTPPNLNNRLKIPRLPRLKILLIAAAAVIILGVAGGVRLFHRLTQLQPLITAKSQYQVNMTPAGSAGTSFRINGQHFSNSSAINFLLDDQTIPGNQTAESDNNGNLTTTLTVTSDWPQGNHTLTAQDAGGNTTQNSQAVTIVPQGQADTPGPNGAPPDDKTFTINASYTLNGETPLRIVLSITGKPDPNGGSVCTPGINSSQGTLNDSFDETDDIGQYTDHYTLACSSGTYKGGKLSFSETVTSDVFTYTNGVVCSISTPYALVHLEGTFSNATSISGNSSNDKVSFDCTKGATKTFSALQGTWTGQVQ